MAGLALVWIVSAPRPAWGQWTGGPTGPIYYNGGNVGTGSTSVVYQSTFANSPQTYARGNKFRAVVTQNDSGGAAQGGTVQCR